MLLNKYTSDTFNRVMEAKSLRLSLKIPLFFNRLIIECDSDYRIETGRRSERRIREASSFFEEKKWLHKLRRELFLSGFM